jgi:hypothetical protein
MFICIRTKLYIAIFHFSLKVYYYYLPKIGTKTCRATSPAKIVLVPLRRPNGGPRLRSIAVAEAMIKCS